MKSTDVFKVEKCCLALLWPWQYLPFRANKISLILIWAKLFDEGFHWCECFHLLASTLHSCGKNQQKISNRDKLVNSPVCRRLLVYSHFRINCYRQMHYKNFSFKLFNSSFYPNIRNVKQKAHTFSSNANLNSVWMLEKTHAVCSIAGYCN